MIGTLLRETKDHDKTTFLWTTVHNNKKQKQPNVTLTYYIDKVQKIPQIKKIYIYSENLNTK
jgi:hypothetical protein